MPATARSTNQAQKRIGERKKGSHSREHLSNSRISAYIEDKLKNTHGTPELIAGRLSMNRPDLIAYCVMRWSAKEKRVLKIPNQTIIDW
ncbi:hypothetical protein Holit_00683 [Hollandina sp. SP2]